ncbi:JAB domain-containing protein [Sphingobium indicum]|uniref:JAB domain-containing protein n=1 Tax=Sphingobium TaxID=165695 RepID=UPI003993553B
MGSLPDEVLRILFLDASYRLIADEQLHHGSVRQLELYPRTIFRRAIEHGATGLILVHNHPTWPFRSRSITPHHLETQ